MRRLFLLCLLGGLLAACGELPHPFEHEGEGAALSQPAAMQPVEVAAVPGRPGLAEAMVAALGQQDLPASLTGGDRFLHLTGQLQGGRVLWTLADAGGRKIGQATQMLPARAGNYDEGAASAAASIVDLLRGEDLGQSDLAARPRVSVDQVTTKGGLDATLLKNALIVALQQKNLAVVPADKAGRHVSGGVRITQGLGGHDLVEVTWVVTDEKGTEIGRVNQGNTVLRDEIISLGSRMTHQIAEGGADGIVQLVRLKR